MTIGSVPDKSFKRGILELAQLGLYYSGAAQLYTRIMKNSPITILMYHSICDTNLKPWIAPRNRISIKKFEDQIRYLAKKRHVLSLNELIGHLEQRQSIPKKSVLLTFDDGYQDTLKLAAPILNYYNIPATLYLATAYVDRGENQWADQLYAAYIHATNLPKNPELRYKAIQNALVSSPPDERRLILESEIERLKPGETPVRTTLIWDEVRELHRCYRNFTIGIHTHEHIDLSSLDAEAGLNDVSCSIGRFRDELGYFPKHFSFPYCRANPAVCTQLRDLGLRSAMTEIGVVDESVCTPWDLKRLESREDLSMIRYWTSGAYPGLSNFLFGRA